MLTSPSKKLHSRQAPLIYFPRFRFLPFPDAHQRVTLRRSTKRRGQGQEVNSNADQDPYCNEIVIVKEMGVCVPKDGSPWGLFPRVVIGDADERQGLHQPRWDGLMPTLSGTAGESVVVNLGHSPFRHPMDGYLPVSEVVHADARFVMQVYKESERMWRDVRHRRVKANVRRVSYDREVQYLFLSKLFLADEGYIQYLFLSKLVLADGAHNLSTDEVLNIVRMPICFTTILEAYRGHGIDRRVALELLLKVRFLVGIQSFSGEEPQEF